MPGKVILLMGARRVGKTVLLLQLKDRFGGRISFLNGEDYSTAEMFLSGSVSDYRQLFADTDLLIIDEAQTIENIGKKLKLIVDHLEHLAIVISGSSSFDIYNQTGEPLVGRSYQFQMYPFSQSELLATETRVMAMQRIEERLIYGMYPELLSLPEYEAKKRYLHEIVNAYLMKDILLFEGIRNSGKMRDLLRLVAYQAGNEVSYDELGKQLGISRNTVEKYLDLLSKTYVVYKLPAFSKNPRKEISKTSKWYFFDNGIRNAVIGDFKPLSLRKDVGALWETFLLSERMKRNNNQERYCHYYFWRSYAGQEVDLIEENDGLIASYEFKWNNPAVKVPSSFKAGYPDVPFTTITKANLFDWVL
jgi:predicted AAA+ superfamily ATPase